MFDILWTLSGKNPPPPTERVKYIWTGENIRNIKLVKKLPDSEPFPYRAMTNGDNMWLKIRNLTVQVVTYRSWAMQLLYCTSGKNLFVVDLIVVTVLLSLYMWMYWCTTKYSVANKHSFSFVYIEICTLYQKSDWCIPRNESARPRFQFLHSNIHISVSDLYISRIGLAYFAAAI